MFYLDYFAWTWAFREIHHFLCSLLWVAQSGGKPSTLIPVTVKLQVVEFIGFPFYRLQSALIIEIRYRVLKVPKEHGFLVWGALCEPAVAEQKTKASEERESFPVCGWSSKHPTVDVPALLLGVWWCCVLLLLSWLITRSIYISLCHKLPIKPYF